MFTNLSVNAYIVHVINDIVLKFKRIISKYLRFTEKIPGVEKLHLY